MFAIVETGGKQYKVEEGSILEIELLASQGVTKQGTFELESVLLIGDKDVLIGQPFVENACVRGKILDDIKARKIIVFKKKAKKQYKRKRGHRQKLQRVQIERIEIKTKAPGEKKEESKPEPQKKSATVKAPVRSRAPKSAALKTTKTTAQKAAPKTTKTATKKAAPKKPAAKSKESK